VKLILTTHSSQPEFNGDCDYAVIDVTPALLDQLVAQVRLAEQSWLADRDLQEISFWDAAAEFYDHRFCEACEEAIVAAAGADQAINNWRVQFARQGYALVPEELDWATLQPQATDADRVILVCRPAADFVQIQIAWKACPHHCDVEVTTAELTLSALQACCSNAPAGQ